MSEGSTHTLIYPVTIRRRTSDGERDVQIETIELRRMTGKDMLLADKLVGEVAKSLEMIAVLSGQPMIVVDELDAVDVGALGDIVDGFSPPAGDAAELVDGAYPLKYPVTVERDGVEERIESLTLRRMRAKEMRLADKLAGSTRKMLEMIATLSDLPLKVVHQLDAWDVTLIGGIIEGFTEPGQKIGATS